MPRKRKGDGLTKRPDGTYHYDVGKKPNRVYVATGKTTREEARVAAAQELERRGQPRRKGRKASSRPLPHVAAPALTLGTVWPLWIEKIRTTYTNEINLSNLETWSKRLVDELGIDRPIASVKARHLRPIANRYRTENTYRKKTLAEATIVLRVVVPMRGMFAFALAELEATDLPFIEWSMVCPPPKNKRTRYLRQLEMEGIVREAPDKDALVHEFLWLTGIRVKTALKLRWTDIDENLGLIFVANKGGGSYTVPLSPQTRRILDALRGDHDTFLFTYKPRYLEQRVPFEYQYFHYRARKIFRAAGIADYRLHDHRHTAACLVFVASRFNIYSVQALLGHADIHSCDRYLHMNQELLRRDLEKVTSWAADVPSRESRRSPFFSDGPPALSIAFMRANDNVPAASR